MATAKQLAARAKFKQMIQSKKKGGASKSSTPASGSQDKVHAAFTEIKKNPPKILAKTKKKKGAAQANKQRVAIALSKAKKAGASVPAPTKDQVLQNLKNRAQNA